MSKIKRSDISNVIVKYYVKERFEYAPDIVLHTICLFYTTNNIVPFNVFNSKFEKQNENNNNMVEFYACFTTQFYITNNNEIYVRGNNLSGALGLSKSTNSTTLLKHPSFNNIIVTYIKVASKTTFVYTNSNKLYAFGYNKSGQTGMKTDNNKIYEPILTSHNFDSKLIQIDCGQEHTLFLTNNGNVYGCGSNEQKQISFDNKSQTIYNITPIKSLKNIKYICCLWKSSLVLNSDHIVMSWGRNQFGCLGINSDKLYKRYDINRIDLNEKVNQLNGCLAHAGCITNEKNELYLFGYNDHCVCGVYDTPFITAIIKPTKLKFNKKIIETKCAGNFNIFKTIDNQYFSFGRNHNGKCLVETQNDIIYPPQLISLKYLKKKIGSDKPILDICVAMGKTYILQTT